MTRRLGGLALALLLAGCVSRTAPPAAVTVPPPAPAPTPAPAPPADALTLGVRAGPALTPAQVPPDQAARALTAFRISCPSLLRRRDPSGIAADWSIPCARAAAAADPQAFFLSAFETAQVGDGAAMATGYYEPEIAASWTSEPGLAAVYRKPDDLVEQDVAVCPAGTLPTLPATACPTQKQRGRIVDGVFAPYYDRTEIELGALNGRGLEIAWADPIDLFFLQIQGSGRLRFPDGAILRIGYAGQNGHAYTGIGTLMRQRQLLGPGQTSMQGMVAWLRANPEAGTAIMRENRSFVFFRELTGPGPIGAMGLPVTPRASVAADPRYVPLGAPVFIETPDPNATGLWIAQDTGGAIKGANRFDTFWGPGEEAARIAGRLLARGRAWLLLPLGTVARLAAAGGEGAPPQR